ncbi:hypothetical protein NL676_014379 [Syzygium grande]|nr:hypothetical protein NL676_014379 [Syzygium grande]
MRVIRPLTQFATLVKARSTTGGPRRWSHGPTSRYSRRDQVARQATLIDVRGYTGSFNLKQRLRNARSRSATALKVNAGRVTTCDPQRGPSWRLSKPRGRSLGCAKMPAPL